MLKKHALGFEPCGLALFLLVMIPTVIWSAVPAPNDVLRTPSTNAAVIVGLTVPPCLAFLFFAFDRKNSVALVPVFGFTACHVIYAAVNFLR